ncbi:MAG TPA: hypothetical protein VK256_11115 [Candidatus Eisenbacteria bacterium]|nr:hypothetical protein [Candidatus Eisenbacteria bacterium]
MRTPSRWGALVLAVAMLAGACTLPGTGAATSPSPVAATSTPASSPSSNPTPANPLGVLFVSGLSGLYTVSLVGIDGRVVASAQANRPVDVSCANGAVADVPMPLSTSNSRVYFMDDKGVVRFLAANGDAGRATTVPVGTSTRRSSFTVSPDDQRIAVVVIDFTASGASTRLYVEDLNGGGNHRDTFSDSGPFTLWATGWHGTSNLVVAKVPACSQSGGAFCCGPQEFHVVDPMTAVRKATVGGPTCLIAGPPSAAGAVCETTTQANVLTWTAGAGSSFDIPGNTPAYLSPDGQQVAIVSTADPTTTLFPSKTTVAVVVCGWIDNSHLLTGGDTQRQPRVTDVSSGKVVPVAAKGECAGRIPGGL